MSCPTCEQILAGAKGEYGLTDWKQYWPYIVAAVLVLGALYPYKRRRKG
jgi:hypothetical protein